MNEKFTLNSGPREMIALREISKNSALVYLQDALILERFEECSGLVSRAKALGAQPREIRRVIGAYLREIKASRKHEAKKTWGGRLRF